MIRYSGINHLAFATADMDMTIRYWQDLLGMRLVPGIGDHQFKFYFFELSRTDMVAFFEWPEVKNLTPISEREIFPGEGLVLSELVDGIK